MLYEDDRLILKLYICLCIVKVNMYFMCMWVLLVLFYLCEMLKNILIFCEMWCLSLIIFLWFMIFVEEICSCGCEGGFKFYLIGELFCFVEIEKIYGYFGVLISL